MANLGLPWTLVESEQVSRDTEIQTCRKMHGWFANGKSPCQWEGTCSCWAPKEAMLKVADPEKYAVVRYVVLARFALM